ncbi:tetratricopeptide repeat protein [Ornithinibacillus scapharcae]|uniref:tetratricopeptide repeat protein n=1 Tax=Ornithinibacillus scapharcae TaxID=1147159 RepID=UPI000225B645|nr:hypothetical protein [Ornithinibacillus scapharcae]
MTFEKKLMNKTFYQTLIEEHELIHPIEILGKMYMNEMQKNRPNLSAIRFAQGEVYFMHHDYEAAIYKWGQALDDKFIPWAQKNIADAHFEMDLIDDAEKYYKEIDTQSIELNAEVLLQLFSLYVQQGDYENAVDTIQQAVSLNPDYSGVTEIAKVFFEDIQDWNHAIQLAVQEAVRTESLSWFVALEEYVVQGLTRNYEPEYFKKVLASLLHIDKLQFETFTEVLWNSYKESDYYMLWLREINHFLMENHVEEAYMWKKLPSLYTEAYFELISGKFLIGDISTLVQIHLTNWLSLSSDSDTLVSSSAILAWNEMFPSDLNTSLLIEAESRFESSNVHQTNREDGIKLFESIKDWAEKENLLEELSECILPMIEEYNIDVASPSKIRNVIKQAIEFLIEKQVEVENEIMEKVSWNEEQLANLQDIQQQLGKLEKEKVEVIRTSFQNIKNDYTQNLLRTLSELLRSCSELIHVDSDFGKLHVDLNNEMNRKLQSYLETTALQEFSNAIQVWVKDCERELSDSQVRLAEISEDFNDPYGREMIVLEGDFKVLDDWKRDMERIARGMIHLENANVMLRNNPYQLFLKGAGKILGSISKNKEKLYSKYKNYIETQDYNQITQEIVTPFIQQLELFEGSMDWDINKFFSGSYEVLNYVREQVQGEMEEHQTSLAIIQEKPEIYRDPLTFFEVKLRQYELMNRIS